ncbi:P-loop NTPase fold protein [Actinoplanes sp. NPDC089786]|uniref:P-loop NTPase fold protein n=1 Tax=Actinoplanes sp. NPDC089786 TaxID=3155185 RepID=UPI00342DFD44
MDDHVEHRDARLARRVTAAAARILAEPEFAGYLHDNEQVNYVLADAAGKSREITADYRKMMGTLRRRTLFATATGSVVTLGGIIFALTTATEVATAAQGNAAGPWTLALMGALLLTPLVWVGAGHTRKLIAERRHCGKVLVDEIRPVLRDAIDKAVEDRRPPVLRITSAPGLAAVPNRLHRVTRPEFLGVDALMRDFNATSVMINGPRGAGKTTLLHFLNERESLPPDLVVSTAAPSAYEAKDFIVFLFKKLCEGVLEHPRANQRLRKRARTELLRLTYLQNLSVDRGLVVKMQGAVDLGWKSIKQLLQQPPGLPELVERYRRFAETIVTWLAGGRLVVIVDELDQMEDPADVARFVNEIKGIFGVSGSTHIVSISDDALTQLEGRASGVRSALDSAFEHMAPLGILTLDQSAELLRRRVIGYPLAFTALGHALAGGLPRHLIREARALIVAANAGGDRGLAALTERAVGRKLGELRKRFLPLMTPLTDDPPSRILLDHGESLLRNPSDDPETCLLLGVELRFHGTVLQIFGRPPQPGHPTHPRLAYAAGELAAIRSILPAHAKVARDQLTALRTELDLV